MSLNEVAEEEGLRLNDQMEITKYLKAKVVVFPFNGQLSEAGQVNALIDEANEQWDE